MKHTLLLMLFAGMVVAAFSQRTTADFEARPTSLCNSPFDVSFTNLAVNDTSWFWDFGDGSTSTLKHPVHRYQQAGTYSVTLFVRGYYGTDLEYKRDYVVVSNPPQDPVLNKLADTVACGGSALFVASSQPGAENRWYTSAGRHIHTGDSLALPFVSQDADFFVRAERESASMYVGEFRPDSSAFSSGYSNWHRFYIDVFADLKLKSFWVDSRDEGFGTIYLEDTLGNKVDSTVVFISEGRGRVDINMALQPGSYYLWTRDFSLRRNTNLAHFPYTLPGFFSITKNAYNNNIYYEGFFDWELVPYCYSASNQIYIETDSLSFSGITQDSISLSCGSRGVLEAVSSLGDSVIWYDKAVNEIGRGDSLVLGFANGGNRYFAQNAAYSPILQAGPEADTSLGAGSFDFSIEGSWMHFEVFDDIEIRSFVVYSDRSRSPTIRIINENGDVVHTMLVMLSPGKHQIDLNITLEKGKYVVGGNYLGLFRNEQVQASYPYSVPGLFAITGSSRGRSYYSCFYDWKVKSICYSHRDTAWVQILPSPSPSVISPISATVACGGDTVFTSGSNDTRWYDKRGHILHEGDSFIVENIAGPDTFFAREVMIDSVRHVGPLDASFGTGNYQNSSAYISLEFEVSAPVLLKSVANSKTEQESEPLNCLTPIMCDSSLEECIFPMPEAGLN
ncbi:MAG: PKD domain-containing protein [Bacteroidia bacterium]